MELLGRKVVDRFRRKQSGLRSVIDSWVKTIEEGEPKNRVELEKIFPTVDYSSKHDTYIFDIGAFRLAATISFPRQRVLVEDIMDHDTYERWSNG